MSKKKKKKNTKNKLIDKIVNNGLIILAITFIFYSTIVILNKDNAKLWKNELTEYKWMPNDQLDELGNQLYSNIDLENANNVLSKNLNKDYINNAMALTLGFTYAKNNNLLHQEEIDKTDDEYQYTGIYLTEDELLTYIDNITITDTLIMEDVILDNGKLVYDVINRRFEYWINFTKNNIIKTSKIYTTCDENRLYIHEFVAYHNHDLIKNEDDKIVYPNSYSNKNYNLGLYINDDNISGLIDKAELDEYIYVFKRENDNYYLEKVEYI